MAGGDRERLTMSAKPFAVALLSALAGSMFAAASVVSGGLTELVGCALFYFAITMAPALILLWPSQ
jgi:hypothetical protein